MDVLLCRATSLTALWICLGTGVWSLDILFFKKNLCFVNHGVGGVIIKSNSSLL
jgi:hypothetical protein